MATLIRDPYDRLRALQEGADPAALPTGYQAVTPEPVLDAAALRRAEEVASFEGLSESERALRQGTAGVTSALQSARGLTRILTGNESGGLEDLTEAQRRQQTAAEFGPRVQSIDDIDSVGSGLEWARNQAIQQLPNVASAIGTGFVGGAGRAAVGSIARREGAQLLAREAATLTEAAAAKAATEGVSKRAVTLATNRATRAVAAADEAAVAGAAATTRDFTAGTAAGGAASGVTQQAGIAPDIVLDPQGEGSTRERAVKATIGAVATGSLEALPVMSLFRKYGLGGAEEAVTGNLLQRVAKQGIKQGLEEAGTELAQTVGERAAHKWVNDNVQLMGPEAYSDYLNAAAGGFLAGGVFGAPSGIRGAGRENSAALGKFRGRVGEIVDKITPNFGRVGERAAPTAEQTAPGAAASSFAEDLSARGAEGVDAATKRVTDMFNKYFGQKSRDDSVDSITNSVFDEIMDAEPLDYRTESGTTIFNRPFNTFADSQRARASVAAGVPVDLAVVASTVPADREAALSQSGALRAAAQALRGDKLDGIDSAALSQYTEALTPEARRMFVRTAATMQELAAADQIQRDQSGRAVNAQIATPEAQTDVDAERAATSDFDVAEGTTEQTALRDPGATYKALRGIPVPRGQTERPAASYRITDANGRERYGSTRQLGQQLAQIKADQDFQDSTRTLNSRQRNVAALAQAAADVRQAGGNLDLSSLRTGMELGRDWKLVPADIAAIRASEAADAARNRRGVPQGPVDRATTAAREQGNAQRERDVAMDPGQIDPSQMVQEAGAELQAPADEQRVLGPRGSRPAELRVSDTGRVSEAQTIDTGSIDREARRAENATQWGAPEKVARVDQGITRVLGKAPANARERASAVRQMRQRLTGAQLNQFNQRVYDAAQATATDLTTAAKNAQTEWSALRRQYAQAQKSGADAQTLAGIAEEGQAARERMTQLGERATRARERAAAERRLVKAEPRKTPLAPRSTERVAKAQAPATNTSTDNDVLSAPKSAADADRQIVRTRSRRRLSALSLRIYAAKNLTMAQKESLLGKLIERSNALQADISRIGANDAAQRRAKVLTSSQDHYINTLTALNDAVSVEDGLKRVRQYATAQQKSVIDTLLATGSLKNVQLDFGPSERANPGNVGGMHYATPGGRYLDSTVTLRYGQPGEGNTNRDVVALLIHESVHAATSAAEFSNPAARRDLQAMLRHVRAQADKMGINPDQWYGMSETQEFLAEAFSNPLFQDVLKSMPAADTRTFKTLWGQFKDFVMRVLGITDRGQKASMLEEVFTVGAELQRLNGELRAESMNNALGLSNRMQGGDFDMFSAPNSGSQPTDYMRMLPQRERIKLLRAFNDPKVIRQIREALPQDKRALLDTVDEGPSLLVNTGLAMAMNNQLTLAEAKDSIAQLSDAIRQTLQIPSARSYARQIITDLRADKIDREYDSRTQLLNPAARAVTSFVQDRIAPVTQALASDMDQRMRNSGVPSLTRLATLLSQRAGEFRSDESSSFLARRNRERGQRLNDFYSIIDGWTDEKKEEVVRALQKGDTSVDGAKPVLDFFREQYNYLTKAGLKLGQTTDYFPVTIDGDAVSRNRKEFIDLLNSDNLKAETDKRGGAEALYRDAVNFSGRGEQSVAGQTFADGDHDPTFRPLNQRLSDYIYKDGTPEQIAAFAKFQDPSLERIAVNYISRATTRAEWQRLNIGDRVKSLLAKAREEGATDKQIQLANDYVDQIMGVYGQDWHPIIKRAMEGVDKYLGTHIADTDFTKVKSVQSALMTYQNVRLLPLALMSSMIDPLGSNIRAGGQLTKHWAAAKEAVSALRNKNGNDYLRAMAEDMGVVERNAVGEALHYLYGGAHDPNGRLAKVNNALFKYNGLELVTKFSRLTALAMGNKFLLDHAATEGTRSDRYLRELGLTRADVKDDGTGHVVRSEKIDAALHRFVDESVVRPTPSQRPGWHNDPHFALAAQYKGYLYSFWNTVMRRAGVELKNGNYRVIAPLLMYMPVTAFGEMMRDVFQDDDDDRTMTDYAKLSVERSGLLGPKINLIQSAYDDTKFGSSALNSLAGPTGQQLGQMYDTFAGRRDAGKTAVEALPGSALYEEW